MNGISEGSVVAISAAVAAIAGLIGAAIAQFLEARHKSREQDAANVAQQAGTEENLRREMAIRLVTQDTKIDLLTSSVAVWQQKFYDIQLSFNSMIGDNERLTKRVTDLEKVNEALKTSLVDYDKGRVAMQARIDALEAERLTLLNRITILEAALVALKSVPVNGKAMSKAEGKEALVV